MILNFAHTEACPLPPERPIDPDAHVAVVTSQSMRQRYVATKTRWLPKKKDRRKMSEEKMVLSPWRVQIARNASGESVMRTVTFLVSFPPCICLFYWECGSTDSSIRVARISLYHGTLIIIGKFLSLWSWSWLFCG